MSMDFGTVQSHVQSWLLDLPSDATQRIPAWINEAIKDAAKRYNFKFMRQTTNFVTVYHQALLGTKPTDWKEARDLPYTIGQDGKTTEFNYIADSDLVRTYALQLPQETSTADVDDGPPRYLQETSDSLYVWPLPDNQSGWINGLYRITVPYWGYPATLAASSDHNYLTDNAEWYVVFKAVAYGFKWNRDEERGKFFDSEAEPHYKRIERLDKLSKLPDRLTLGVNRDVYATRQRAGNRG